MAYLPFDISRDSLLEATRRLRSRYPALKVVPVIGDFTSVLPARKGTRGRRRVVFIPGSTLGNFDPPHVLRMLRFVGSRANLFLVGIDLAKDPEILEAAYNDAAGVTASFNKNLLSRLARESGTEVNPDDFVHEAFYREAFSRIEMHLVARRRVRLRINGEEFRLSPGESIHTENSYKYTAGAFESLSREAGFQLARRWTDERGWFGVFLLRNAPDQKLT